jgi:hypothetical protein
MFDMGSIRNTDFLSQKNAHDQDQYIQFFEDGHKYVITPNVECIPYISVTTFNHTHFAKFDADLVINNIMNGKNWNSQNKYWGQTPQQIKKQWSDSGTQAAELGTQMHFQIECYMNDSAEASEINKREKCSIDNLSTTCTTQDYDSIEWQYFMEFVNDHLHLVPYRTEWIIFHKEYRLAGSVDMVYENDDGTLSIYDWKRTKDISGNKNPGRWTKYAINPLISHIPDTNYWHYALQLNTYKMILETQYGKKIRELILVRLHPLAETYELIPLPDLQVEVMQLMQEREQLLKK